MPTIDDLIAPIMADIAPDFVAGPVSGPGVFTGSPDAKFSFSEIITAPTDVIQAYDGTEQRVQLRGLPLRRFVFTLSQIDEIATAEIMAKLYRWVGQEIAVPAWSDAMALTAALTVGATVPHVASGEPAFSLGGPMMLWLNRWTYEFVSLTGSSFDTGTTLAWPKGAFMVPMVQMIFDGDPQLTRMPTGLSTVELHFVSDLNPYAA